MTRAESITKTLIELGSREPTNWGYNPKTKKDANKLLFTCAVDYQTNADFLWFKVNSFIVEGLCDPNELWAKIRSDTETQWVDRCKLKSFHRFPQAYKRLWRIAGQMEEHYKGDARRLWRSGRADDTLSNLEGINFGPQLSRMTVGALRDLDQVSGCARVKADLHVRRVLGRLMDGEPASEDRTTELTKLLYKRDPWRLDSGLFQIGRTFCRPKKPNCGACPLSLYCVHAAG